MRFFHNLALAMLVAVAATQGSSSSNPFLIPQGGWQVTAGQPITMSWTPTTQGPVTLQLQWGSVSTPTQGITIASGIPNTGSYTWTPPSDLVSADFTVRITAVNDPNEYNYSPRFTISGTTGSTTPASSTPTPTASSSVSASTTSGSSSASVSKTKSSSASATTSPSSSSSSASSTSASSTPSSSSTPTPTPTPSPVSTSAPNNSGSSNAPSAFMALLLGLIALL